MKRICICVCLVAATTRADELQELKQQLQQLQQRIEALETARTNTVAPETPPAPLTAVQPWSPAQPITLGQAGSAYINLSLVGDVAFGWSTTRDVEAIEGAHHDPSQRGFTLQAAELTLDGAVDPYFKALATIPLVIEPGGETVVELEEAWVQTTSLPWDLQLKAGQFFANFGRQNTQHAHAWAFVDQPMVITRLLGGDGLRNPGAQLSWLAPTPNYTELTLGVFNSDGETAASFRNEDSTDIHGGEPVDRTLRGPQDLLFVPRVSSSLDLNDTQTIVLGLSGAFGPNNSGRHADTQIYGADVYWKWRPLNAQQGFPFVSWQTEALLRRYDAATRLAADDPLVTLPGETLTDWGFYTQLLYGFRLGWVAGLRGEFVSGNTGAFSSALRQDRTRLSPNLTWYPTEFSKLRLQYNYDHGQAFGDEHSVWMQLEFLIGAHAAHKF
jgi:hypothetical protein